MQAYLIGSGSCRLTRLCLIRSRGLPGLWEPGCQGLRLHCMAVHSCLWLLRP